MLEVLGEDYVRTARAKGLAELNASTGTYLAFATAPGVPIPTGSAVALETGWR